METHWKYLQENFRDPVLFDGSSLPSDAFSSLRIETEDEFRVGTPKFDNFTLKLYPDAIFTQLVYATRSPDEIWIEITLTNKATDIPTLRKGEYFFPRKERLIFWGKCLPNNTAGHVDYQENTGEGSSSLLAASLVHDGSISFTFMHWLVALAKSVSVSTILDEVRMLPHPVPFAAFVRVQDLLYTIVKYSNPTLLFAISDHRLKPFEGNEAAGLSVGQGNIQFNMRLLNTDNTVEAVELHDVYYLARWFFGGGGFAGWLAFFDDGPADLNGKKTPPEHSFYLWKDGREALLNITSEFELDLHVELPCFSDIEALFNSKTSIKKASLNFATDRKSNWASCSRWLFVPKGMVLKPFEFTPFEKTIDYNPCASWVTKARFEQPTAPTSNASPNYTEFISYFEDGTEITGNTLARLQAKKFLPGTMTIVPDASYDIYNIFISNGAAPESATEAFIDVGGGLIYHSFDWADIHAYAAIFRWGQPKATAELEFKGTGVEKFTEGVKNNYGFYDWGEFPLVRYVRLAIGLLGSATYRLLNIDRNIGANGSIKVIEILSSIGGVAPTPDLPPRFTPPDPPVIDTPSNAEPLCGHNLTLTFNVTYLGEICDVLMLIDGLPVTPIVLPSFGSVTPVQIIIDPCTMAIGNHSVTLTITPCNEDVAPVTAIWNFTVNHLCC